MFDLANDRLSYSQLLRPDAGFALDFAVGMTYSLDLEALLGVPVSLGLLDDMDEGKMRNPLYILEAIRKSADRIALFCNAGGIKLPDRIQSVFSLLENSVFQVKLGKRRNFHPKIWVLKYSCEGKESYIKLLVMSRNLTFDSSIDISASMKGAVGSEKGEKNRPLADLLRFVSDFAGKKKQQIQDLAEDVERVAAFEVSPPFEDYDFYPIGIRNYPGKESPLFSKKGNLFVVSPFLTDDIVLKLTEAMPNSGRCALVTRKSSVTPTVMNRFKPVYVTKDILSDNEFDAKQDIHAKLFFATTNEANYLYLGSANATYNAFNRNVECLLRLRYKLWSIGYEKFKADFIPAENCPYEEVLSLPERQTEDKRKDEIDNALREAVFALNRAYVSEEQGQYSILVKAGQMKTAEKVEIAPLQKLGLSQPLQKETTFYGLLLKELSEFFMLRVDTQTLVVKLNIIGMPKNRDQEIYRSIIKTKQEFMQYLAFVLSGNLAEGAGDAETLEAAVLRVSEADAASHVGAAVYEQMLLVLHKDPARLKGIADMIQRLDPEIVGDEFRQVFEQFQLAAKKVRR